MRPVDYLVRVPLDLAIPDLDRDRWLLVMPAWEGNPVEGTPVAARHAAELFADGDFEIGRAWMPDVRQDLEALAGLPQPKPAASAQSAFERHMDRVRRMAGVQKRAG
jgi:hypothetical protein